MRSFFDTNLLVYADSADEPAKQRRAIELITEHRAAGTAVISTQVLQEFVNVALRKLRLPPALIREGAWTSTAGSSLWRPRRN